MTKSKLKLGLWALSVGLLGFGIFYFSSVTFQNIQHTNTPENTSANTGLLKKDEKPREQVPDFVTLSFLGDIMLDRGVEASVNKNFEGDFSKLFTNLEELKNSDITFLNFEGTASDKGKDVGSIYSFRMNPIVIPIMKNAGIDIISIANNHVGDWGRASYEDMINRLQEEELAYTGGGINSFAAETPTIIEKNGMKIGFLGFADNGPGYLEAKMDKAGFLSSHNPRFAEIVKSASEQVDYLIVSFHWGDEYKTIHNSRQEYLAHMAIDNGAKVIAGHHPHVIQDTEVYKEGFIAYSLGNFIFDQYFSPATMQGMWLELKLSKDGNIITKKNIIKLNRLFQPDSVIKGVEEKIEFTKTTSQ